MSLQVWLPLNGNLENKGLSNFNFTTLGTITYPNGKIGKCMKAGDGTQIVNGVSGNTNLISELGDEYSCAVWICPDGTHIHYNGTILSSGNWNSSCWAFGVNQNNTAVDVFCKGYNTYIDCSVPVGQWTHLACTQKNKIVKLYKNGEYVGSYTASQSTLASDANNFCVGRETYAGGYFSFNGKINDVRIYNHCLSDKEVKEIAKGLVLHYKLDGSCGGNDNLLINTESERSVVRTDGNTFLDYTFQTKLTSMTNTNWVFSFDGKASTTGMQCDFYFRNSGGSAYADTSFQSLTTEYVHYQLPFTGNSADCKICRFRANAGSGTIYIKNVKLEAGTVATPWTPNPADLGIDSTKIIDVSGNGYDGTVNGSLTTTSDTVRYLASTVFDGSTASITLGNLATICPEGNFTFNCWIYKDGTWSTKSWETILGGPSGFELECKLSSNNSPYIHPYSWGGGSVSTPNTYSIAYDLNKWNMITMTRTSSGSKFYLNGELKVNGIAGTIPSGNYFIGAWNTSSGQNYKGKVSDVRIYNTILSDSDIKELYETSASIDKNGNIYCREMVEV